MIVLVRKSKKQGMGRIIALIISIIGLMLLTLLPYLASSQNLSGITTTDLRQAIILIKERNECYKALADCYELVDAADRLIVSQRKEIKLCEQSIEARDSAYSSLNESLNSMDLAYNKCQTIAQKERKAGKIKAAISGISTGVIGIAVGIITGIFIAK